MLHAKFTPTDEDQKNYDWSKVAISGGDANNSAQMKAYNENQILLRTFGVKVEQEALSDGNVTVELYEDGAKVGDATYTYDGTAKTPTVKVTVKNGTETLTEDDYTVEYTNNINAGKAEVTITGNNYYTFEKTIEFNINKAVHTIKGVTVGVPISNIRRRSNL